MFLYHEIISKISSYPAEVLLNNKLDAEVKKMFYPFYLLQTLLFSSKFCFRDNYITPKGKKRLILEFSWILFAFIVSMQHLISEDVTLENDNNAILTTIAIFLTVFDGVCLIVGFILNIVHSNDNIVLVVMIQIVHKSIDCSNSIRCSIVWNWISVSTIFCVDVFILLVFRHLFLYNTNILFFLTELTLIGIDLRYVYAFRIQILLNNFLKEWNKNVYLMNDVQENHERQCTKLFNTYKNILKAYDVYKKVSHVMVMFSTIDVFGRTLCYVQTMIDSKEHHDKLTDWEIASLAIIWLVKDMALLIIQNVNSEKFYIAIKEAETACLQLMKNIKYTKSQARLCKNVILTNRTFSKMTAGGLFYVGATLQISLLALLTNYVFVLLQFAFL